MNLRSFLRSRESQQPHFLLLGNPVGHSLSPVMHNRALGHHGINAKYRAINLQRDELAQLAAHFNADTFLGANITIPYKQLLIDYLDELDPIAEEVGAVNTVVRHGDRLKGFNTDVYGFLAPLREFHEQLQRQNAIVFGTGGASRAVVTALDRLGMNSIKLVSRNPGRKHPDERTAVLSYQEWTAYSEQAALIVNATPLGMYPNVGETPVREAEKQYLADKICYDIVYNPLETQFLHLAKQAGATGISGLEMLIQQGSRAFELWTGQGFPLEMIRTELHEQFEY